MVFIPDGVTPPSCGVTMNSITYLPDGSPGLPFTCYICSQILLIKRLLAPSRQLRILSHVSRLLTLPCSQRCLGAPEADRNGGLSSPCFCFACYCRAAGQPFLNTCNLFLCYTCGASACEPCAVIRGQPAGQGRAQAPRGGRRPGTSRLPHAEGKGLWAGQPGAAARPLVEAAGARLRLALGPAPSSAALRVFLGASEGSGAEPKRSLVLRVSAGGARGANGHGESVPGLAGLPARPGGGTGHARHGGALSVPRWRGEACEVPGGRDGCSPGLRSRNCRRAVRRRSPGKSGTT